MEIVCPSDQIPGLVTIQYKTGSLFLAHYKGSRFPKHRVPQL